MAKHGKSYLDAKQRFDRAREYAPSEAIALVKQLSTAKFDESVEVHDRAASRSGQGRQDRGVRPGRQGA